MKSELMYQGMELITTIEKALSRVDYNIPYEMTLRYKHIISSNEAWSNTLISELNHFGNELNQFLLIK